MPLSEFLRMARRKIESHQRKPCSNEPSSRAENGLLELVWENGQIVTQGQASKVNNSHNNRHNMPLCSNTPRIRDPGLLHSTKIGKFGEVESILDDVAPVVPSGNLYLSQDDDTIRCYPVDDPLPRDYCSNLIPEISGVTTTQDSILSIEKRAIHGNLHCDGNSTLKGSSSNPHLGSGGSDVIIDNPINHHHQIINTDLLNFSHFSKPAFLAKSNAPPHIAPSLRDGKTGFSSKSNRGKSLVNEQLEDDHAMVNSKVTVKETNDLSSLDRSCTRNEKASESAADSRKDVPRGNNNNKKIAEAVVTSSVGSGNSADDRVSYGQTKRKFPDVDESEYLSDDIETESVGVNKPTNGSKRRRAAEVHNLSERRRRDRINEKMRALQEVIPNCNKVDKASMLDEAIEYLKTLQLQVQVMSMGAGLFMPPPLYHHPSPHFPLPLAGMGVGYGINNMMHGGGFPVQRPHFTPFMAGESRIQVPCSTIAGYGNPGQGVAGLVLPMGPHHAITSHMNINVAAAVNKNSQLMCDSEAGGSMMNCLNHQPQQQAIINEGRNESESVVRENERMTDRFSSSTELSEEVGCSEQDGQSI